MYYTGNSLIVERGRPGDKKKQINPQISDELDKRLGEIGDVYEAEKYLIVRVALEYGIRHFKKAWDEYNVVRKPRYDDADDPGIADTKVIKLTRPTATEPS